MRFGLDDMDEDDLIALFLGTPVPVCCKGGGI